MKTWLTVGALLASASPALAWNGLGGRWNVGAAGINYSVNNSLSSDLTDRDALEAINRGYAVWTVLPCSYMAWTYAGRTDNGAWATSDNQNIAVWYENGWSEGGSVLGVASPFTSAGGEIVDCDTKYNGQDHTWSAPADDATGGLGGQDIVGVVAHESGHCIGLDHTDVAGSTMLPAALPGIQSRSLGADDIQGACELYPSGGEVPDPDQPPPPPGTVTFGGDCAMEGCSESLFCVNSGREQFCTRVCNADNDCGEGFHCAGLTTSGGACARGEGPPRNIAGFGEACGAERRCDVGLRCILDPSDNQAYCSGPCVNDECPGDFYCAQTEDGSNVCARGIDGGALPGQGEACARGGICGQGMFCINDRLHTDEETGEVVPYCTVPCEETMCAEGYRCVDLPGGNNGCQKVPSAGDRNIGDPCWVNPEAVADPDGNRPSCGEGMECVGFRFDPVSMELIDRGVCTQNCSADQCCPVGYGCQPITAVFAQCVADMDDGEGWECTGERPGEEPPVVLPPSSKDDDGCNAVPGAPRSPWAPLSLLGLVGVLLLRRRRRA
jgi:MYXO-CTERM domain-containing protein